jgi:hypothetical protein
MIGEGLMQKIFLGRNSAREGSTNPDRNVRAVLRRVSYATVRSLDDRTQSRGPDDRPSQKSGRRAQRIMKEILDEHQQSRNAVMELEDVEAKYLKGDRESLSGIIRTIRFLVELYPRHIEKEDGHFFLPCMEYFSQEEKDTMLTQEYEFDRKLIHQIYKEKVTIAEVRY